MNNSDEIWVNLKVLARLEPSQKLNTKRRHFQLQSSNLLYVPEFVIRWWIGSNRESDFNRLKELYTTAAEILKTEDRDRMIEHLTASIKGLESLQKTYENDATTKAKIDWLIDTVNTMVKTDINVNISVFKSTKI